MFQYMAKSNKKKQGNHSVSEITKSEKEKS